MPLEEPSWIQARVVNAPVSSTSKLHCISSISHADALKNIHVNLKLIRPVQKKGYKDN